MTVMAQPSIPLPRLWLALALIGWGGLTNNLSGAIVMALLLEGISAAPLKWALTARNFHRAADLTSVLFALITVVQFSRYSVLGIYQILQVAPYGFFPLVLVQRASTAQSMPMSALFYSLRRQRDYSARIDIAPPYVCLCLLAASSGAARDWRYLAFCGVLVFGMLLAARPQRYRWTHWLGALTLAVVVAGLTQLGIERSQRALENAVLYWVNQFPWSLQDPNRAVTAIGTIGRLKLSDQIRLRVTPSGDLKLPLLLQEASYDVFNFGSWQAHEAPFAALDTRADGATWAVNEQGPNARARLEISVQHRHELSLLPLPRGTRVVASKEIAELQNNRFGTLMAESPPGALRFAVEYAAPASVEPPPRASDRALPSQYESLLSATLEEIGGAGMPAAQRAARIRQFFLEHFQYSLIQPNTYAWRTPLAEFLRTTRRGHCEYFATASVLLLRAAGIPARYAVGYVVEDYSAIEHAYIARARHAHAWALAYIDGAWITLDSTPANWYELEDQRASAWQPVQDWAAWLVFRYQRLSQADLSHWTDQLLWLVAPLAGLLYWRLRRSPMAVRTDIIHASHSGAAISTLLAPLLACLAAQGLQPAPGDTMAKFLRRAAPDTSGEVTRDELLQLYNRLRYGRSTTGLNAQLESRLRDYCASLAASQP